ncbi:7393_t:CDS:2 [Gigaspora margarita]|uniref:7393_t:CDS:1 n=1 Tax=Gigaspora margarita TaxID=4874 RepID=A0ABN7UDF7_GIGMA|nr:7393_t:CDS:2 [Gigaspora margarita]
MSTRRIPLCEKNTTNKLSANTKEQSTNSKRGRKKKQPARQNTTVNNVRKTFQHNDNEVIEENDSEITRPPPPKKQKSQDKRPLGEKIAKKSTSSYMNVINCDNSDQEYQESIQDSSNLALDTDNDNITEPRLTPPLPINDERLSNDEFEELYNNNQVSQKPDKLQGISSEFEAAIWLAKHPRVLDLAFEMRHAMSRALENSQNTSSALDISSSDRITSSTMIANLESEAKALFLRTRNNTPALYTELVSAVCGISKADKQIPALIKKVGSCFDDYRYRFLAKLRKRADECLNQFDIPTDAQLLEFISEDIWCEILCQFLEATEQHVLRHNKKIWNALGDFVREAIKKIITSKLEGTDMKIALRSCDAITVNLQIPTVLGVVARLPVQDLLKCKTSRQRHK